MEATKLGRDSELFDSEEVLSDRVSSSEDECENQLFTCYSCSEEFPSSDMYRCKTCADEGNAKNHVDPEKYFCQICIVGTHLRRKHVIIDHKGYKPSVCGAHKNLDEFFCKTCTSVFCPNCTREHISHEFQMLEEKAIEVRKQVFELITSNEILMKPFKRKEAVAEECLRQKEFYNSLRTAEGVDTLSSIYTKLFRTRSNDWPQCLEKIPKVYAKRSENLFVDIQTSNSKSDEQLTQMKEILKNSEGCLVKSFIDAESIFAQSIKEREEKRKTHIYMKWTVDIDTVVKNSIKTALKEYKLSQLDELEMIPTLLTGANLPIQNCELDCKGMKVTTAYEKVNGNYLDEMLDQHNEGDECHFLILRMKNINQEPTMQKTVMKSVNAKCVLFKLGFLAVCLESNTVYVYSLSEKRFVYQFEVSATHIPLSLHPWMGGSFSFVVWSREQSQVQIQKRPQTLHLPEQLRLIGNYSDVFAFVYSEDTITVWDRSTNVRLDISNVQHGLSSIDKLKLADQKTLFLFDYRLGVIVKFQFDVSSEASLTSSLRTVFNLSSFADSPLKFVTVMGKTIVAQSESDDWYSAELPEKTSLEKASLK